MRKVPSELGRSCRTQQSGPIRKGTSGASFASPRNSGVRRGQSRVAGWVPVMRLAEQTGRQEKVLIAEPNIKSGSANPAPKLTTLIAGMCAGADSIDDIDALCSGGMKSVFGGVYAPSTVGTLLREFTFGHARQLESVLREHLVALCGRGRSGRSAAAEQVFVDIDFAAAPGLRARQQGASYGHTKHRPVSRSCVRGCPRWRPRSDRGRGSGDRRMRLRAGRAPQLRQGRRTHRPSHRHRPRRRSRRPDSGARGSAYGNRAVVAACVRHGAQFSLVMTRSADADRGYAWTRCHGAVTDPSTGAWISDAEVAKSPTPPSHPPPIDLTARLVVRRVKDAATTMPRFPVWRYHPFFTNTEAPVEQADITHRRHAIINLFADLIDGPWRISRRAVSAPAVRGDRPQPAARRRILSWATRHPRTRIDAATQDRQRPRPTGPPATSTHPAPAHPLALVEGLACAVAQHDRIQPTNTRNSLTTRRKARPEQTGKAGQTSRCHAPLNDNQDQQEVSRGRWPSVDRGSAMVKRQVLEPLVSGPLMVSGGTRLQGEQVDVAPDDLARFDALNFINSATPPKPKGPSVEPVADLRGRTTKKAAAKGGAPTPRRET